MKTLEEILKTSYREENSYIIENLLNNGVSIIGGKPKVGKSLIAIALAYHISGGHKEYLGMKVKQMNVAYFSTENREYEIKERAKKMKLEHNQNLFIECKMDLDLDDIQDKIKEIEKSGVKIGLVVLDTLQHIIDDNNIDINSYADVYELMTKFRNFAEKNKVSLLLVTHTGKKNHNNSSDDLIGSTAFSGASDTIITLKKADFSKIVNVKVLSRQSKSYELYLEFNEDSLTFKRCEEKLDDKPINKNLITIMRAVINSKNHTLKGSCQELAAQFNLDMNPAQLGTLLSQNQDILSENYISYKRNKEKGQRVVTLCYKVPTGE